MNERITQQEAERLVALAQRQTEAVTLIMNERDAAERKFPNQHLEQGTGPDWLPFDVGEVDDEPSLVGASATWVAWLLKERCQKSGYPENPDTWAKVIGEEFGEYIEEDDPAKVKAELVQLGAMVVRALEDIIAAEEGGRSDDSPR